ncbi:hypothetical protein HAX54_019519, partial [Datura stramonium]|nr:hypothetical protein [Datura stramonium]
RRLDEGTCECMIELIEGRAVTDWSKDTLFRGTSHWLTRRKSLKLLGEESMVMMRGHNGSSSL